MLCPLPLGSRPRVLKSLGAFELWCWTARRSNQSIRKEIKPEYWLEGLVLKLKLQFFGHLMQIPRCWERLKAGGKGGDRGWDSWMVSLTQWTWVWANSGRYWRTEKLGVVQFMGSQRVRHNWATEQQLCQRTSGNPRAWLQSFFLYGTLTL